ncbi:hypothetical protein CCR75_005666 [Bremia lactucae]|uniref:PPIase cyclophilin-type domain-containing protein n=1 Tax=Bremia lactucae TaxID=4779 RepID=A0A976IDQ4_BRELC|nr:hypothetical protein CCR75_005666 [Bremia lactucae]
MSSIYITEPNTEGKVLLLTSFGDLDVELWPQQAPKACRNFLQLCLEGYYNQTIFHRLIAGFLVQGGDPTGTGCGGKSIYGGAFADEFHSRLKFSHRGLLAMANENKANTNHSQFFFTLDACEFLNKKYTIFGKIAGNTIFNLLSVSDLDTDALDRPINPPKLLSAEVLWNPFEDIIPRTVNLKASSSVEDASRKKKRERKAIKDLKLLSFGDEEEAYREETDRKSKSKKAKTMISSHDLLDDRILKSKVDAKVLQRINSSGREAKKEELRNQARLYLKAAVAAASAASKDVEPADKQIDCAKLLPQLTKPETLDTDFNRTINEQIEYRRLRDELRKSKKAVPLLLGEEAKQLEKNRASQDMLTPFQQKRQNYLQRKRVSNRTAREQDTLSKLKKFQAALFDVNSANAFSKENANEIKVEKESYHGQILGDDNDDDDTNHNKSWMTAKLKFKKHIDDQFRSGREPSADDYTTIDSRRRKSSKITRKSID